MKSRQGKDVIGPQFVVERAGGRHRRSIATRRLDYLDPFLPFDHFGSDNPGDYPAAFPMHPHRGIETVTCMLAGLVDQKDRPENSVTVGAGDSSLKRSRPCYPDGPSAGISKVVREDGVRIRLIPSGVDGGGRMAPSPRLAVSRDGDGVIVRAEDAPVRVLLLSGKTLNEPIARFGPFVMATKEETAKALEDLRNGTFAR